ncbi:type II toxin-antitoxin system HicB family antitoxin [Paraburkholderia bonniea]|uniref:type II toxin-antitoxin system HicB family antitoxin n=1 Tax=Paraburkholderia bonniea TaxID=2152891 RepID=UPI0031B58D8A
MKFPVTLTPDEADGGFVVTFSDIPEAITQGETTEEALAMAQEALETAMEFYFEDKRVVPTPSKPKRGQPVIELPASLSA